MVRAGIGHDGEFVGPSCLVREPREGCICFECGLKDGWLREGRFYSVWMRIDEI